MEGTFGIGVEMTALIHVKAKHYERHVTSGIEFQCSNQEKLRVCLPRGCEIHVE